MQSLFKAPWRALLAVMAVVVVSLLLCEAPSAAADNLQAKNAKSKDKPKDEGAQEDEPPKIARKGHPRNPVIADHPSVAPTPEAVAAATTTLEGRKGLDAEGIRLAQLRLWLEHDESTQASLPAWHWMEGLAPFGKTSKPDASTLARLAALTYLGCEIDQRYETEFDVHLPLFSQEAKGSSLWWASGAGSSMGLLVDAIFRHRGTSKQQKELRKVIAEPLKDEHGRPQLLAGSLLYLATLKKHKLLKLVPDELRATVLEYQGRQLERAIPQLSAGSFDIYSNTREIWHSRWGIAGEMALFIDALKIKNYTLALKDQVSLLQEMRAKFADTDAGIHLQLFDEVLASTKVIKEKAPKLGVHLLTDSHSVIDQVRTGFGLENAAPITHYRSGALGAAIAFHRTQNMASAAYACLALAEGFEGKSVVNSRFLNPLLEAPENKAAFRTLLSASVEHDPETYWQEIREAQRGYYLRSADAVREGLAEGRIERGHGERTSMYRISDAAGVLMALSALDVSYQEETRRKLYTAFLEELDWELPRADQHHQTYCFSLCLLALQQEVRCRARAGVRPDDKPISGKVAGEDDDYKAVEDPNEEETQHFVGKKERRIAGLLADKILASYGVYGFGYKPIGKASENPKAPKSGHVKDEVKRSKVVLLEAYSDNSNSQFAMIGLKTAMVMGAYMPTQIFENEAKRLIEILTATSNAAIALKGDGSEFWDGTEPTDEEREEAKKHAATSRVPVKVTPAGVSYGVGSRAGPVSPSVSSGIISSLILCREVLKNDGHLEAELDKKIRIAVFRTKLYYAGHEKLEYEALTHSLAGAYHLFGVFRASYTDGNEKILGRDWREEAKLIWMRVFNMQNGDWVYGGPILYEGLITLSLNGIKFPITTLAEDIAKEDEPPPPAKSAGD